jgi:type II secretory pathway component PulF
LLKSGIALADAIDLMAGQSTGYLNSMLSKMRDELKTGKSFATTLEGYPKSFPPLFIQFGLIKRSRGKAWH